MARVRYILPPRFSSSKMDRKKQWCQMQLGSLGNLKESTAKTILCHLKKSAFQNSICWQFLSTCPFLTSTKSLNHLTYKVRGVGTIFFFWFFNGICASLMAMNEIQRNSSHREFLRWDIDKSCRLKWTTMVVDMMGELRALGWPQW